MTLRQWAEQHRVKLETARTWLKRGKLVQDGSDYRAVDGSTLVRAEPRLTEPVNQVFEPVQAEPSEPRESERIVGLLAEVERQAARIAELEEQVRDLESAMLVQGTLTVEYDSDTEPRVQSHQAHRRQGRQELPAGYITKQHSARRGKW